MAEERINKLEKSLNRAAEFMKEAEDRVRKSTPPVSYYQNFALYIQQEIMIKQCEKIIKQNTEITNYLKKINEAQETN